MINSDIVNEVEVDVVPLDVCGVVLVNPYMYVMNVISMRRANKYYLINDGNSFSLNTHKGKPKLSLVSAHQAKRHIRSSTKYEFISLSQNQQSCIEK
jgi:hypothetical protein